MIILDLTIKGNAERRVYGSVKEAKHFLGTLDKEAFDAEVDAELNLDSIGGDPEPAKEIADYVNGLKKSS